MDTNLTHSVSFRFKYSFPTEIRMQKQNSKYNRSKFQLTIWRFPIFRSTQHSVPTNEPFINFTSANIPLERNAQGINTRALNTFMISVTQGKC